MDTWLGVLRRRWAWGAGTFVLVVGAAAALLFLSRPVYRAEARLRLGEPPPMSGVSPSAGVFGLFRLGGDPFANDLEILGSRSLREAVVEERALHVRLDAPRGWHRDSLLVSLAADRSTDRATFEASWTPSGEVQLRRTAPRDSLVGVFAPGAPASFGGVRAVFRPRRSGAPDRFSLRTVPFGEAVRETEGRIRFQRASRDANVLDVSYDHADPAVAHGVVSSATSGFVAFRTLLHQRESGETVDSLRVVAGQTLAELGEAETRLESLQRETGLVAPEAQSEALVERYSEAVAALETARAELGALTSVLGRVEAAENPGEAWVSLVAHPRFLENQTVGDVLGRLTLLEERRVELAARRTRESIEHSTVVQQIAALDASLRALARNYRTALDEQVGELESRVAGLESALAGVPATALELGRRQRDARLLSEVLVLTEQRLRQEELRQALTFANVQVIDPPALRFRPVWPRRKLGMAVALLMGSGFALLGMVVVERADGSVRSARGLSSVLATPLLAALPLEPRNGRGETLRLSPHEADALLRRGRLEQGRAHLQLAAVGAAEDAARLARALEAVRDGDGEPGRLLPEVTVLPAVDSHAAASAAAVRDAPVLLVLRAGATEARDVARVRELLESAGARVAGGVLVCRTPGEARAAWS